MTPEPKAPASDLDAAVGSGALVRYLRREAQKNKDQRGKVVHGAHFVTRARKLSQAADRIEALEAALSSQSQAAEGMAKALEWALDQAGAEHPHYPERTGDGAWRFPYLVHGSPMGGGVGEARYPTALEAVRAAMTWPGTDDDAPSGQTTRTFGDRHVD